jgi:hypothetical protein
MNAGIRTRRGRHDIPKSDFTWMKDILKMNAWIWTFQWRHNVPELSSFHENKTLFKWVHEFQPDNDAIMSLKLTFTLNKDIPKMNAWISISKWRHDVSKVDCAYMQDFL